MKFIKESEFKLGPREVGYRLSMMDSQYQAEFFDELAIGFLLMRKKGGDEDGIQMLFIKDVLSEGAKEFILKFAEYIKIETETGDTSCN